VVAGGAAGEVAAGGDGNPREGGAPCPGPCAGLGTGEAARVGRLGWVLLFIGPDGPIGLSGHRASPWATSGQPDSCHAGLARWAKIAAQHSPSSCSCRPRPEIIVLGSCSCRAKLSCFEPAHGPRAFWLTIAAKPPEVEATGGALVGAEDRGGAALLCVRVDPDRVV
jgi:hypothetical protein